MTQAFHRGSGHRTPTGNSLTSQGRILIQAPPRALGAASPAVIDGAHPSTTQRLFSQV